MADKKIVSATMEFHIPKHATNAKSKDITIKLPHTGKYDVYQKDMPANLPEGYTWINNFGLKERKKNPKKAGKTDDTTLSDAYATLVDEYLIELDDVEGKEPVYFDGTNVQNFPGKKTSVGDKRAQVKLALGDPPVGWP